MAVCQAYAFMIVILSLAARAFLTLYPEDNMCLSFQFVIFAKEPFPGKRRKVSLSFFAVKSNCNTKLCKGHSRWTMESALGAHAIIITQLIINSCTGLGLPALLYLELTKYF